MQYFPELKKNAAEAEKTDAAAETAAAPDLLRDRSEPGWARLLSLFFAIGGAVCVTAFCLLTVFLYTLVFEQKQFILAPLLTALALAPAAGLIIFEAGHAHALKGHRRLREKHALAMQALAGAAGTLVLALVHPLLALPAAAGMALSWLAAQAGRRLFKREPLWDFLPSEAVSALSGRDARGLALAGRPKRRNTLLSACLAAISWLSLVSAFALAVRLAAADILAIAAAPALSLITFLCVLSAGRYFQTRPSRRNPQPMTAASVASLADLIPAEQLEDHQTGLYVSGLNAFTREGNALLADISFAVEPGTITGLQGDNFSGKSLLMRCLADPYHQQGLDIRGAVLLDGDDLWKRSSALRQVPSVHLPPAPRVLPASGAMNLSCFHGGEELERGRKILKQMAFSTETADFICAAEDARTLSDSEQKMLAYARAFLLRPRLLLLDRPEDFAGEKQIAALAARLQRDRRLGLTVLMATGNRKLLEMCDRLLVLQGGRVIDTGPADEIRARTSAGWSRFVTERELSSEEALDSWLSSLFRRDGDEGNRRTVCTIANELLAFSCQGVSGLELKQDLRFEFKHFDGHCILRMIDQAAQISTGVLEKARAEAEEATGRLSPLAAVLKAAEELEAGTEDGQRVLEVKIATYDPRVSADRKASGHARR
jgi:ABC-type multidrug transport system ATPase subunit